MIIFITVVGMMSGSCRDHVGTISISNLSCISTHAAPPQVESCKSDVLQSLTYAGLRGAMRLMAEGTGSGGALRSAGDGSEPGLREGSSISRGGDRWSHVRHMVVYGLGSVVESRASRYQVFISGTKTYFDR